METQSFEIPVKLWLVAIAFGAAGCVLGKEISKKGLTSLGEVVMVSPWLRTLTSTTQTH